MTWPPESRKTHRELDRAGALTSGAWHSGMPLRSVAMTTSAGASPRRRGRIARTLPRRARASQGRSAARAIGRGREAARRGRRSCRVHCDRTRTVASGHDAPARTRPGSRCARGLASRGALRARGSAGAGRGFLNSGAASADSPLHEVLWRRGGDDWSDASCALPCSCEGRATGWAVPRRVRWPPPVGTPSAGASSPSHGAERHSDEADGRRRAAAERAGAAPPRGPAPRAGHSPSMTPRTTMARHRGVRQGNWPFGSSDLSLPSPP